MYGNKFYSEAFYNGDKCNSTLKTGVFLLFNFSLQTTFPYTSPVSTIFIMMHRIHYLRSDNFITNIYYIHIRATVLKQKSPTAMFKVKNLFCGHVT